MNFPLLLPSKRGIGVAVVHHIIRDRLEETSGAVNVLPVSCRERMEIAKERYFRVCCFTLYLLTGLCIGRYIGEYLGSEGLMVVHVVTDETVNYEW